MKPPAPFSPRFKGDEPVEASKRAWARMANVCSCDKCVEAQPWRSGLRDYRNRQMKAGHKRLSVLIGKAG